MSQTTDVLPEAGSPRLKLPQRDQIEFRTCSWNALLPDDHQARIVWQYVESLDLSSLYQRIKAVERRPGQSPIDPKILFALWLYATLRGIGSARELNRRCDPETGEVAFQWICGGVSVNYHTLSDFRTDHLDLLDDVLTSSVAVLMKEGLVTLDRVAQDGMKVRASAGAASFRRGTTLAECLSAAQQQVESLKQELDADPTAASRRQQAGANGPQQSVSNVCKRRLNNCHWSKRKRRGQKPKKRPVSPPPIRKPA